MNLPFMLRSAHSAQLRLMADLNETLRELVGELKARIIQNNAENEALMEVLATQSVMITPKVDPKSPKVTPFSPTGRGGWRARARMAAEATIPSVPDSAEKLKAKVKKEGGINV